MPANVHHPCFQVSFFFFSYSFHSSVKPTTSACNASTCSRPSDPVSTFVCFLFTLIRTHHLYSHHHPCLHARPSAHKAICTHTRPSTRKVSTSTHPNHKYVSFLFFFFTFIDVCTQRICTLRLPSTQCLRFFFVLFFILICVGMHAHNHHLLVCQ